MKEQIPSFLLTSENHHLTPGTKKYSFPFIDNTIKNVATFIKTGYLQSGTLSQDGLLQRIDARVLIFFLVWYIVQISIIHHIKAQLCVSLFFLLLFFASRLNVFQTYKRIVAISFFFGFLVIAPASLNLVNDGRIILHLFHFQRSYQTGTYHIPAEVGITWEGVTVVAGLYLKILNSVALSFLVMNATAFHKLIKALKMLKVPDLVLLILTMTYKFVFIMANTTLETYFALKLRWWTKVKNDEAGRIIAGRVGHIFRKSWHRYEEVYLAMIARGFTGSVNFYFPRKIKGLDAGFLFVFISIGLLIYLIE
jgi:energy-coupling factor transporter transmembrane protein EcfT